MDLAHALKVALTSGKVRVGLSESLESLKAKQAKLVIVSKSCPSTLLKDAKRVDGTPVYHFEGTAQELGAACGKPFPISTLAVLDAGASSILTLETG